MSEKNQTGETSASGDNTTTNNQQSQTSTTSETGGVSKSDLESLRSTLLDRLGDLEKTKESPEKESEITKLNQRIDKLTDAIVDSFKELAGVKSAEAKEDEKKMVVTTPSGQSQKPGSTDQNATQTQTITGTTDTPRRSFLRRVISG